MEVPDPEFQKLVYEKGPQKTVHHSANRGKPEQNLIRSRLQGRKKKGGTGFGREFQLAL